MPNTGQPLEESTIDAIVAQFRRDRSRYERMVDYVRQDLERILANDLESHVKYQVHWRVKSPGSLKTKLMKKGRQGTAYALAPDPQVLSLPELLDRIPDLAALRVLTYTDEDLEAVTSLLKNVWNPDSRSSPLEWPEDDPPDPKRGTYYQAVHLCVRANVEADPDLEHLRGIKCEVQVTTTADHLLNEVAHDLLYKPSYEDRSTEKDVSERVAEAKELLRQVKGILTDAVRRATEANTRTVSASSAAVVRRNADNALGWLLDETWSPYRPGKLDRRSTRGKQETIPYLVRLGEPAVEPEPYLLALPGDVRATITGQPDLMKASFESYFEAARRRGWGRDKSKNPRHLREKSQLDRTIMALLLKLEGSRVLAALPARTSGRPTVAMDIVDCFMSRDAATTGDPADEAADRPASKARPT